MKPENKGKLVRGVVVVGGRNAGCIGKDRPDCITAYTFWYRHDGDLARLERELETLAQVYRRFHGYGGCMTTGYEYKDYKRI